MFAYEQSAVFLSAGSTTVSLAILNVFLQILVVAARVGFSKVCAMKNAAVINRPLTTSARLIHITYTLDGFTCKEKPIRQEWVLELCGALGPRLQILSLHRVLLQVCE